MKRAKLNNRCERYGCAYVENRGGGLNTTDKFQLDRHGWNTEKFNVTTFDTYHVVVGRSRPKLSYQFDFTRNAADDVTSKGCKPH